MSWAVKRTEPMAQSTNTKSYIPSVLQVFLFCHGQNIEFLISIKAENAKPETVAERKVSS